jgi:hypothetical protein
VLTISGDGIAASDLETLAYVGWAGFPAPAEGGR